MLNYKSTMLVAMLTSFSVSSSEQPLTNDPLFDWSENILTQSLDGILNTFGASQTYGKELGLNSSIIQTAYYPPEKGLGTGALYVGLYNVSDTELSQPSSISLNSYYSENNSYGVSFKNKNFFEADNNRLFINANVANDASSFMA